PAQPPPPAVTGMPPASVSEPVSQAKCRTLCRLVHSHRRCYPYGSVEIVQPPGRCMFEPHPLPEDAALRAIVPGVVAATGHQFFSLLVQHLAVALNVPYTFMTEFVEGRTRFRS